MGAIVHDAQQGVVIDPADVVDDRQVVMDHRGRDRPAVLNVSQPGARLARLERGLSKPPRSARPPLEPRLTTVLGETSCQM